MSAEPFRPMRVALTWWPVYRDKDGLWWDANTTRSMRPTLALRVYVFLREWLVVRPARARSKHIKADFANRQRALNWALTTANKGEEGYQVIARADRYLDWLADQR